MGSGTDSIDDDLLAHVASGDALAFALLYDRYGKAAYLLALGILAEPDGAEDVVQDVFLKLWLEPLNPERIQYTARAWLLSIVRHRAIDQWRRHRYRATHQQALDDAPSLPDGSDTAEQAMRRIEGARARAALLRLSPKLRRVVVLAYFRGHTHEEIARLLDVPLGTVKGRLRVGLQQLRHYLRADIDDHVRGDRCLP
jgi:RNA polymerase sigma-70 factor (ECF subfamily)